MSRNEDNCLSIETANDALLASRRNGRSYRFDDTSPVLFEKTEPAAWAGHHYCNLDGWKDYTASQRVLLGSPEDDSHIYFHSRGVMSTAGSAWELSVQRYSLEDLEKIVKAAKDALRQKGYTY